jgi:hypothetical protein
MKKTSPSKIPNPRLGKGRRGITALGGRPRVFPPLDESKTRVQRFDIAIEVYAKELKGKYLENNQSIDLKVIELKEQFRSSEIHDWNDTQQELLDVARQRSLVGRTNTKGSGTKT